MLISFLCQTCFSVDIKIETC